MLLTVFSKIPDQRSVHGRRYELQFILFFSVLAILSGADSYRKIELFIKENFTILKDEFNLKWKKPPVYTGIRKILVGVNAKELEKAFRKYSKTIAILNPEEYTFVSMDGKVLRGSFDNLKDQRMIQIFSAFLTDQDIILAHEKINCKTNEIPTAQKLVKELGIGKCIFTMDALHCQKKRLKQ